MREEREADCREESREERRRGLAQVREQCRKTLKLSEAGLDKF